MCHLFIFLQFKPNVTSLLEQTIAHKIDPTKQFHSWWAWRAKNCLNHYEMIFIQKVHICYISVVFFDFISKRPFLKDIILETLHFLKVVLCVSRQTNQSMQHAKTIGYTIRYNLAFECVQNILNLYKIRMPVKYWTYGFISVMVETNSLLVLPLD